MRRFLIIATILACAGVVTIPPGRVQAESSKTKRALLDQVLPEVRFNNVALKDALEFLRDVTGANIHVNWRAIEAAGITQDTNVNMRMHDVQLRKVLNLLLSEAGGGTGLTYYFDQNVLEVTTKDISDKQMFTRVYPVEDLVMEIPDFTNGPNLSLLAVATGGSGGGGNSNGGGGGGGGGVGGGGGGGAAAIFGGANGGAANGSEKGKTPTERGEDLVTLIRELVYPDQWRDNGGQSSIRYFSGKLIVTAPRSVHEAIGGPID